MSGSTGAVQSLVYARDSADRERRGGRGAGADRIVMQEFLPDDLEMVDLLGDLARTWAPADPATV